MLPISYVESLVSQFSLDNTCELTFEMNPDDADKKYLKELKNIGINRLSIGSQTFNDYLLNLAGRRHNSKQIIECINMAKDVGFQNISLDLIYGLPTQTLEILKDDLEKFISLDIQHISTYGLKIEENSSWGKLFDNNEYKIKFNNTKISIPDDDYQADMYELINNILEKNGFNRYEISNFSKKGYESRHNLNYWDNAEYYGFGIAAHGYINGIRYSNYSNMSEYLNNINKRELSHKLSMQEKLEEEIFLGFRKRSGVNIQNIRSKYNIDFENKYKNILIKYSGYIEKTPNGYTLNLKGVLLSNIILSEFLA